LLNTAAGKVDDHSLAITFWTAAGIMFAAFFGALLFARNAPPHHETAEA